MDFFKSPVVELCLVYLEGRKQNETNKKTPKNMLFSMVLFSF